MYLEFFLPEIQENKEKEMATHFLSTANTLLLPSSPSSSSSSSSSLSARTYVLPTKCNVKGQFSLCKAVNQTTLHPPVVTKRSLSFSFLTSFVLSLAGKQSLDANAAILEADDDEELLEKVKRDRKKRLERQGVLSSSGKETGTII